MTKKCFFSLVLALILTTCLANANTTIQQIQSPIYTDDIGRSHFLGRGGYSTVRQIQMNQTQADFVNDATMQYSNKKEAVKEAVDAVRQNVETDITNVIKERTEVPVSAKTKMSTTAEDRKMDPSASFGQGSTYLQGVGNSGVNNSKTIYTDDIGRLHFFGKGNLIRE